MHVVQVKPCRLSGMHSTVQTTTVKNHTATGATKLTRLAPFFPLSLTLPPRSNSPDTRTTSRLCPKELNQSVL